METPYSDDKHDLMIEKGSAPLLPSNNDNFAEKPKCAYTSKMHLVVLSGILLYFVTGFGTDVARRLSSSTQTHVSCPTQPKPLGSGNVWQVPENYSDVAAGRLSRAVQIPAVSYDNMGAIGEDKRWDAHYNFDEFLAKEYPQVYSHLKHEAVNTHGHLYTWAGSDSSLQPIVLMAHQDVVPVNPSTLNQWTHNPFDGVIEDGWVWGRGAADCKNQLMGIMSALDKLIQDEYKPERTILVAFGFDEEIGGVQGAAQLSAAIRERYGKNSVAFLVDEGFGGVDEAYGATFASLGMAEKGYVNMDITIETPGGHSSVPPEHTGIGLLSQAINQLEAHPYTPHLTASSPYLKYLTCLADYSPKLPGSLRKMIKDPKKWGKLARELSKDVKERAFLGTTQAVDLISGGVKVNALPEEAKATVNYRIDFTSSVAETKARISKLLLPIAHKHQLTYVAFNKTQPTCPHQKNKSGIKGKMTLSIGSEAPDGLEPAPITSDKGESFKLMGGTIRGVFGKEVIVAPSAMFANTDTRHFWDVTENLYRFIPASVAEFKNPHTVDERVSVRAHVTTIRFFYELIRNMEGWRQGDEKA